MTPLACISLVKAIPIPLLSVLTGVMKAAPYVTKVAGIPGHWFLYVIPNSDDDGKAV
jgi:hypothetical protein